MKLKSILIPLSAMIVLSGCNGGKKTAEVVQERVDQVRTTPLAYQEVARQIELSSTLEGYETMNISPSVTGTIEKINVEVGDRVKKGDVLVVMNRTQLNTARITVANLKTEMARVQLLHDSEAVSQQVYDQTKASYDQAVENLAFLEENTIVKAKFDGVISAKNYEDGELYSAAMPILVLTQINRLKSYINVPETFFPIVKEGMSVDVVSDIYKDQVFPAKVEIVYPTIDPASHTFTVKLNIPNAKEQIRPGMYVKVTLALGKAQAMTVPYAAVQRLIGSNNRYLYVNDGGVAKRVFVQVGTRHDGTIEISSDELKVGDEIITTGQSKLVEGVKVNVVK